MSSDSVMTMLAWSRVARNTTIASMEIGTAYLNAMMPPDRDISMRLDMTLVEHLFVLKPEY